MLILRKTCCLANDYNTIYGSTVIGKAMPLQSIGGVYEWLLTVFPCLS